MHQLDDSASHQVDAGDDHGQCGSRVLLPALAGGSPTEGGPLFDSGTARAWSPTTLPRQFRALPAAWRSDAWTQDFPSKSLDRQANALLFFLRLGDLSAAPAPGLAGTAWGVDMQYPRLSKPMGGEIVSMKKYRCLPAALVILLALAPFALAQQADTALIVGTVADTTGAVIPGVNVTFSHVETGIESVTETNETGNYRSNPLRIGTYLVVVESDGFKTYSGSGVHLSIGDVRELNVALEVGAVTEVIEVEAAAPLLQTTESSAGTVIENRQIVDLPLNGRNYLQLAVISAGTAPPRGQGISIGGPAWHGSQLHD